jgi:hypothetical protein|tara:strand:+ start:98 stop:559 length:462 start_codon:yes stop_codon:yes gene_type:complete
MKILSSYKKIAKELIKEAAWDRKFGEPLPTLSSVMKEAEVDDDKIIKYKDKEGESQEMTAGAAKKQPDEHPAKVAYSKMADGGGDGEKDSYGDDEEYDEKLQNFKGMVDKTMDRYRKKSESISINGKKYKAIKESKEPTIHLFKKTYKKIGGK